MLLDAVGKIQTMRPINYSKQNKYRILCAAACLLNALRQVFNLVFAITKSTTKGDDDDGVTEKTVNFRTGIFAGCCSQCRYLHRFLHRKFQCTISLIAVNTYPTDQIRYICKDFPFNLLMLYLFFKVKAASLIRHFYRIYERLSYFCCFRAMAQHCSTVAL